MKIAVLGIRGFPAVQGGPEVHSQNLYPLLVKRGCDVTVFARRSYVDKSTREYDGVKLIILPCIRNKFLEAFFHTFIGVLVARKLSPDILHIHAIGPSLFVPLAKMLGMKVVMTNHGPDYKRKKWGRVAKAVLRFGEYLGSRYSNAVICVSQQLADDIATKYRRDVVFIPNGVNIPEISKSKDTISKYGLEKNRYIMAVGRFVPEKGFHDLIDAFKMAGLADWKLAIVGDATHQDSYTTSLKRKTGNDIIFTGVLSGASLEELYSNAGIFVLPSYYEALSIALLEAMSYGLSCIVSDIPANLAVGLPRYRYFKTGDIKELAQKIREFSLKPLSDEEKKRQIEMVAEKYNWDIIADQTRLVYKKVSGK
ncbi:MAG: glycosyltransferase family 4 protein [Candidatus Omnitrophica bacterium]|nr:glycosyltransferase family 4 protein [Candidatus Omnitrophota bacterium]